MLLRVLKQNGTDSTHNADWSLPQGAILPQLGPDQLFVRGIADRLRPSPRLLSYP